MASGGFQSPPSFETLLRKLETSAWRLAVLPLLEHARREKRYLHWNDVRHRPAPEGATPEQWWLALKMARQSQELPLRDGHGRPFGFCQPPELLEALHRIDLKAGGRVGGAEAVINHQMRDRHLITSLQEEAIASSQLEGAATTRDVARNLIRSGRPPRNPGEQMILNNFQTMDWLQNLQDTTLTPELVLSLHRRITQDTLETEDAAGRLRRSDENVRVENMHGEVVHDPPPAEQLQQRLADLCDFANGDTPAAFLHPVIRAITLHFWLAYDHPFVDGNGRTARALFYWAMLRHNYWLFSFISISTILRQAPGQYARAFIATETDDNDLTYFLLAQLKVIAQALDLLDSTIKRKNQEMKSFEQQLADSDLFNHRQLALLLHAMKHPGFRYSIRSHGTSHKVSYQTARTDLLTLANHGLLEQRKRGRQFLFQAPADLGRRLQQLGGEWRQARGWVAAED